MSNAQRDYHPTPHRNHSARHIPITEAFQHANRIANINRILRGLQHSFTKTQLTTAKEIKKLGESSQHNDCTEKYVKIVLHKSKHKHKGPYNYYTHQQSNVLEELDTGKQAFGCLWWIGDISNQLLAAADPTYGSISAASASSNLWGVNPYDQNPNQLNVGGTVSRAGANTLQDVFRWHNCKGEHQITNMQNVTTTFTLYYFTPKCNIERDSSSLTTPTGNDPVTKAWAKGISDLSANAVAGWTTPQQRVANKGSAAAPVVGPDNGAIYGSNPFRYPFFNKMFKVLHVEKHALQPGSTKKIHFDIEMNCSFDKEYITRLSENSTTFPLNFLGHKSVFCYIIARSVPVLIANEGEDEYVAPGPVKLVSTINYTNSYTYPVLEKRKFTMFSDNNYPSAGLTFTPANNIEIVNDTDMVDNVEQAT